LNLPRGIAIGAHAKRIGVVDLEQIRDLVEYRGDVGVMYGHVGDLRLVLAFADPHAVTFALQNLVAALYV